MTVSKSVAMDADAAQLEALGYKSEFKRDMSFWQNLALGFTYLSPVVGIYALFSESLAAGGPPMIWALIIAGLGQLFVAMVFGEVVSQYPIAGGVYPWARRLWGRKWAWMTGWVYVMALFATIASVTYGAAPYTAVLAGYEPSVNNTVIFALIILLIATIVNQMGTRILAKAALLGFIAEIIGTLFVGSYLLLFNREHGLEVLFNTFGAVGEGGSYLGAFLAASLIGVYAYYGFEACGDVAEEVPNASKRIPKAMRHTIYIGGATATFLCLGLLLSVADYSAVINGEIKQDVVITILTTAFGPIGGWIVIGVVLVSFLSCSMSLQAAASRLLYSYARDGMVFGSKKLSQLSINRVPSYSLLVAALMPGLIVLTALFSTNSLVKIISFASVGIYVSFQMVVFAALRARLKGWKPSGQYSMGKWGPWVNIIALSYGVAAILNICWPRTPNSPWYDNYIVLLSLLTVVGIGLIYLFSSRPYLKSDAPYADATKPKGQPLKKGVAL